MRSSQYKNDLAVPTNAAIGPSPAQRCAATSENPTTCTLLSDVISNIVEEKILLTPPTSGPIACNQLKLAPPGRWHETLHVYSVVVCVDNRW